MVDRDTWTPPEPPVRESRDRVPGALGGSRLLDLPRYADQRARLVGFAQGPGPRALEIGFDHGITLVANARAMPDWRWLGVEIRKRRVAAVQPHVPDNCLAERLDARILLASGILDGALRRVDILFPTPPLKSKHMLFSEALVADLGRCLAPGGVVHVATDVPALGKLVRGLFAGWQPAADPSPSPELSRRDRVCKRDGIPVARMTFTP
jgi:hypothetical protein